MSEDRAQSGRQIKRLTAFLSVFLGFSVSLADAAPTVGHLFTVWDSEVPRIYLPSVGLRRSVSAPTFEALDETQTLEIRSFRFEGNTHISSAQLSEYLSTYQNLRLTPEQIYQLPAWIDQIHLDLGWVVKTEIPPQTVTDGVLLLRIVEQTFAGVSLDYGFVDQFNLSLDRVEAVASQGQQTGDLIDARSIERGQLLAIDLHGVSVSGGLKAADEQRQTLDLWVDNAPRLEGSVALDRGGNRFIGRERLLLDANFASPFGRGGSIYSNARSSEDAQYVRLAYRTPIGYEGTTADFQFGYFNYRVDARRSDPDYRGSATHLGFGVRHPLVRSLSQNHYLTGTLMRRSFKSSQQSAGMARETQLSYPVSAFELAFDGNQAGQKSYLRYNLTARFGEVDLSGSPNRDADRQTASLDGSFSRLFASIFYSYRIQPDLRAQLRFKGQLSSANLDDSERFILGGPEGIRAYPSGEGLADSGVQVSLSVRKSITDHLSVSPFIDWGEVWVRSDNRNEAGAPLVVNNRYTLSGYGISARWQGPIESRIELTWSKRFKNNPVSLAGRDWDGSNQEDQFWFDISVPF